MDPRSFSQAVVPLWWGDRAGLLDFVRLGAFAACDASGRLIASAGDPTLPAYLRSSAKPFQAIAFLRRGLDVKLGLTSADIACACASHEGQDVHAESARRILAAGGNTESDLLCGTHPLSNKDLERRIALGELEVTPIRNNCSGKHSAMLAVCRHEGWPTAAYTDLAHPLQQENLATLATFAGLDARAIVTGVDNCTVPTFALPLAAAATAFARLLDPRDVPTDLADAGGRAARAMMDHPHMVGGDGRLDTTLMELTQGRVVIKTGANGYHCAAGRPPGGGDVIGFAMKLAGAEVESQKAAVTISCMERVGLLSGDEAATLLARHAPPQRNCRGAVVGEMGAVPSG